ncbi:uncharacterized protein LOC135936125 [Cloeon dipterum]|uniref:uncharacterized protein LOC135936125 n=1 Tax=Cloeon dipterum TaxID=197152 RepID=UPI00321FF6D7
MASGGKAKARPLLLVRECVHIHTHSLTLLLLLICLQIFTCSCSSLDFQQRGLNSWEILIGANENEFLYDFCRYDATENIERCKNKPQATVAMKSTCNCSVNYAANVEEGFAFFTVNCNNQTVDGLIGGCPQKLTITYEHGDASAEVQDESNIWMLFFLLSLVINVILLAVTLFMIRSQVSSLFREKWEQLINFIASKQTGNRENA